jgi:hypothetical protein
VDKNGEKRGKHGKIMKNKEILESDVYDDAYTWLVVVFQLERRPVEQQSRQGVRLRNVGCGGMVGN